MGRYFMKHHQPHQHMEISATYFYMANFLLKIDHKIVHKWPNAVLKKINKVTIIPIHMVAIRPNRTVLQGCANVVHTYGHKNTKSTIILY